MKIGIKFFPDNAGRLKELSKHIDFAEVMAIEGADFAPFQETGLPVTLHCEHSRFGVNPASIEKRDKTVSAVNFALELADRFSSRFVVVHPGVLEDNKCSLENTTDLLKQFRDKRIVVENLPLWFGPEKAHKCVAPTPEEMEIILSATGNRVCLDFGHAAVTAHEIGEEHVGFVKRFMELKPSYFHISDNDGTADLHMSLGEGKLDIKAFKGMVGEGYVALETDIITEKQINDIRLLKGL